MIIYYFMAQKSIHILNKNGYSMFWNSMWDDKINYSKFFKKFFFLKLFFQFLIEDYNSYNFFKKNKFIYLNQFKYINHYFYKFNNLSKIFKKNLNYKTTLFFSKIWLLRYQSWIIIFFFIFDSFSFKKSIPSKKTSLINNLNFIFYKNIFFLNFNFNNYKKRNFSEIF